jgi:hypothetical protein
MYHLVLSPTPGGNPPAHLPACLLSSHAPHQEVHHG